LIGNNEEENLMAARKWCRWETHTSRHFPDWEAIDKIEESQNVLSMARIETHYFVNHCFLETDNWFLDNIISIRHIPTRIIQGRYDMVCPIRSAWDLVHAIPEANLHIISDGGHSVKDPSIASGLVQELEEIKETLLNR
jgi:proline iminopeptidase